MTSFSLRLPRLVAAALCLSFTLVLLACQSEPPSVRSVPQTLVISRWEHRLNDDFAVGVDLDGVSSEGGGGCAEAWDYRHVTAPRRGIDNQYAGLLLALLESFDTMVPVTDRVTAELEAGRSLYGIRLDAPAEDDTVEVTLLSFVSSGPLPRPIEAQAADGALVATPIASSVARPTQLGLRVSFPVAIGIPMGAMLGEREVEEIELELELDEDGIVRRGDFGGVVTMATVMAVAEAVSPVDVLPSDVARIAQPDLRPDERGSNCSAVSIGLGLDFVRLPER